MANYMKIVFQIANSVCLAVMAFRLIMPLFLSGDDDDVPKCALSRFVKDDGTAVSTAKKIIMGCGIAVYVMAEFVFKKEKIRKNVLKVYIPSIVAFAAAHFGVFIAIVVYYSSKEYNKASYTECIVDELHGFKEAEPPTYIARVFTTLKCCSPDGDIVAFWAKTGFQKDSRRPTGLDDIPKECCEDGSFTCLKTGTTEGRLTKGCYEASLSNANDSDAEATEGFYIYDSIVLALNLFLIAAAIYLYKRANKPKEEEQEALQAPEALQQQQQQQQKPEDVYQSQHQHQPQTTQGQGQPEEYKADDAGSRTGLEEDQFHTTSEKSVESQV